MGWPLLYETPLGMIYLYRKVMKFVGIFVLGRKKERRRGVAKNPFTEGGPNVRRRGE